MNKITVPFLDLKPQYKQIKSEIDLAIQNVVNKQFFILGDEVAEFEKEFSKYIGVKEVVSVNSGTDALILSLRALGIGPGDEVITQSNSFIATSLAITELGAIPVFVDIDPNTLQIDVDKIQDKISKKTKAILVVHLYGASANIERIKKIAKDNKLYLVEDAAQSVGSTYKGKKLGSFGDLAAFSFYPGKNLGAYGDAGAIGINNKKFVEKIKRLRNYGQKEKYNHVSLGINSRMDEIQAAVLRVKLKHIDSWNRDRNKVAQLYKSLITSPVKIINIAEGVYSNYHLFVIRTKKRKQLMSFLSDNNITSLIHYPTPIHKQKCYQGLFNNLKLPETVNASKEILSIPIYSELSEKKVKYISDIINDFYEK